MSTKIVRSLFIPTYTFDGDIKDSLVVISRERRKISSKFNAEDDSNPTKRQIGLSLVINAYYNDGKYISYDLSDGIPSSSTEGDSDFGDQVLLDGIINGDLDLDSLYKYQLNDDNDDDEEENGASKEKLGSDKEKVLKLMVYKKNDVTNLSDLVVKISLVYEVNYSEAKDIDYIKILKRNYSKETELRQRVSELSEQNAKLVNENKNLNLTLGVVMEDAKRIKEDVIDKAVELINTKKAKIRELLKNKPKEPGNDKRDDIIGIKRESSEDIKIKKESWISEEANSLNTVNDDNEDEAVESSTQVKLESSPRKELSSFKSSQQDIEVKQEGEDQNTSFTDEDSELDDNDNDNDNDNNSIASTEEDNSSHSTDLSDEE